MINIRFQNLNNQFNTRVSRSPGFFMPVLLFVFCIVIFGKLYNGYEGDFRPQGVHSWAQADRFSIARNYYDNGLNFFVPQTNYLEFSDGKTGVEFPVIQYITAVIAKPFGARDQLFLIYRVLCFLFLCVGLQFLLLTIKIHGGNGFQQLLIPLFFLLSPVILFYGFNFLPDIPAFSLILISYHYFEKFRLNLHFNYIYHAIAWGSAAALLKITAAMFPFAYISWFLVHALFFHKQITQKQILQVLLGFIVCFGISMGITYFFSIRANTIYKSGVFLSMSRHINKWTDFSDIWERVVCWHREYFRESQYWVLLIAFIVSLDPRYRQKGVLLFKGILLLGMGCFVLLMGKQLMDHDYYAICTIIPIVLILCIDGLMLLSRGCFGAIVLLFLVQNMLPKSLAQSRERQSEIYVLSCMDVNAYRGYLLEGSDWLERNNIPKSSKIFVLYDFPLNTPLVYLDRKGMVLNEYKMKDKALVDQWFRINKPDLIMIPVQWKDKIKTDRPDIEQRMKLEYSGKDVMTYRYLGE